MLLSELDDDRTRQQQQAERGLDGVTYFILAKLVDEGIEDAEEVARRAGASFSQLPNWRKSEKDLREVRRQVTFAIYPAVGDLDRVATLVDGIFNVLQKADPK